ncbi:hypothetical protein Drorol1_Dr00003636 [Drosera rotundifolia]
MAPSLLLSSPRHPTNNTSSPFSPAQNPPLSPSHLACSSLNLTSMTAAAESPRSSPSSERRFWAEFQDRVDDLVGNRKCSRSLSSSEQCEGGCDGGKRLKEDSIMLMRGFDAVAGSLSRLRSNLDSALMGARELAKPPTLMGILENKESEEKAESRSPVKFDEVKDDEEEKKGKKRKLDLHETSSAPDGHLSDKAASENQVYDRLKKARSMAVSMATKAAEMARELKSLKKNFFFMKERCNALEEENQSLRDRFENGIIPEEEDLVRLQLEALLAEKSRLAYENSNLTRENECLRQLVEYHQFTSLDLSASHDDLLEGVFLNFSSPLRTPADEEDNNVINEDAQELDSSKARANIVSILDL